MPELPLRRLSIAAVAAAAFASCAAAEPVSRDRVTAALPQVAAMAEALVASRAVPGLAIVVVHADEIVYAEGFGLRDVGGPAEVDGDTVFQLASMSKPVSATVVAALVGDGVLDWATRIADLAPDYQLHDAYPSAEVTVRDLFNHRSGLPGTSGNDLEAIGFTRETVMRRLRLVPPSSSFRAGYSYSNAGLTMGALAAVRPTGKDWETIAKERLFDPLGMTSTSFRHADFAAGANSAALHVEVDGDWAAALKRDATAQAPAGGASASARDLGAWMRVELASGKFDGAQVIAADALAATHVPLFARGANPITDALTFYGLGWVVEYGRHGTTWGHAGAFSLGARTVVMLWPDADLGITVLANAFPTGAPEGVADSFADLVFDGAVARDYVAPWDAVYAGLFGPAVASAEATYAAKPDPATPALPASAYVGTYANPYVGEAVVAEDAGGLVLVLGPTGATRYALTHFDRDLFLYYSSPDLPTLPDELRFAVGPDGMATALTAGSLNDAGLGTLARMAP